MLKAINETNRRRKIQTAYNSKNGITPETIRKIISEGLINIYQSTDKKVVRELPATLVADQLKSYEKDPLSIRRKIKTLRAQMKAASDRLEFEEAARIRDEVKRLEVVELQVMSPRVFVEEKAE
jgi:excinuclease ABC subunit B